MSTARWTGSIADRRRMNFHFDSPLLTARDFGPRAMLSIVGYEGLWTFNNWYWLWTPCLGSLQQRERSYSRLCDFDKFLRLLHLLFTNFFITLRHFHWCNPRKPLLRRFHLVRSTVLILRELRLSIPSTSDLTIYFLSFSKPHAFSTGNDSPINFRWSLGRLSRGRRRRCSRIEGVSSHPNFFS